jgi:hypothetical protein
LGRQERGICNVDFCGLSEWRRYPLENSAAYIVREMKKGNRIWLPGEEVSRLRDLLGRFNTTQGTGQGQQLTKTLALPLSRRGNQDVKSGFYESAEIRQ